MIGDALLTHLSSMGTLSAEDVGAIRSLRGEVRTLRRHKDIFTSGDTPRFAVIVLKGFLCRYTTSARGTRQIHSFCMATDAPSLEALSLDYMDDSLATLVSSVVGLLSHADIQRLMDERPGVAALIRRAGVLQGSIYRQWLMRNSIQPAHASMAHLFCEIYVRADAAGLVTNGSCGLPVTQENLGEALGLTAVHVNRTLQLLRQIGLVDLKLGQLRISDFDELAKLAEFDPHYLHLRRGAGSLPGGTGSLSRFPGRPAIGAVVAGPHRQRFHPVAASTE
jgi:CRP-like cAMP-binding protein